MFAPSKWQPKILFPENPTSPIPLFLEVLIELDGTKCVRKRSRPNVLRFRSSLGCYRSPAEASAIHNSAIRIQNSGFVLPLPGPPAQLLRDRSDSGRARTAFIISLGVESQAHQALAERVEPGARQGQAETCGSFWPAPVPATIERGFPDRPVPPPRSISW